MKLSDRLIWESEIKKREHDVVLANGAKHRCFDTTMLSEIPTVDAEPVVHGHWNEAKDGTLWCSVCISTAPYDEDSWGYVLNAPHYDYCPNCGAKMDGERREDERSKTD